MSYMGIKQHCITLHRDGYLDTWRRPQKMGRPEMVYRLTRRTHDLFHADSHQLTLDLLKAAEDIYGPNAPEKLLYSIFKKKTATLKAKAKGETVAERAKWLAHVRDGEGYMAEFLNNEKDGGPQILECHSPLLNVLEQYAIVSRFEQDMVQLNPEQAVVIRGDEAGAYKNIVTVLNICTEAGITNVAFATAR